MLNQTSNEANEMPAIILQKAIIFPTEKVPLVLEGKENVETLNSALGLNRQILIAFQKNSERSDIGVVARILQYWYVTAKIMGIAVEGLYRARIENIFFEKGINKARVIELKEKEGSLETEALARKILEQFKKLLQAEGNIPLFLAEHLGEEYLSPERTSDVISSALKMEQKERLKLLETLDLKQRLKILDEKLKKEFEIFKVEEKLKHEVSKEMEKTTKEFFLREQLKAIEKELGIFEEQKEYEELEKKIKTAGLPSFVYNKAIGEFNRLKTMSPVSAEAPFIRTYLEWLAELPWSKRSESAYDLKTAKKVLDEDHYGLEKTKRRVLEYLAVQKLMGGKAKGSILCFVGPPGTGKTSVGKSIARALGRNFTRVSLGGLRDEAEIRGHRRTYVGALPGRIIQSVRNAGTKNPVFMLDEIDKIGIDFRGDPSAALLEVLDPEQNNSFSDHYLEIPFDLSEVFFITAANILDPVPPALRDRLEIIEFPGYTDVEKFHIAKKFLLPKILESHGLNPENLVIKDNAISKIIDRYTREAGVRELERKIKEIARRVALKMAENKKTKKTVVTEQNLSEFIGPEEFDFLMKEKKDEIGVATGLAWTQAGGEIIFIEANLVPGKGKLTLTGHLGEIMRESAKAALSYVRSKSKELEFDPDFFYKNDVHIHVPAGAIPKDGPSSGIAMAAVLASALTKKKIKKEIASTGEITLSGKVLKIGGVKEKILAAERAGIKTVILPKENEANLIDVPEGTKKKIKFKFVENMDEVLKIVLD